VKRGARDGGAGAAANHRHAGALRVRVADEPDNSRRHPAGVRRRHVAGAIVRHDRRVRVVVDVAAERRARGRDRETGAAIFVAAVGRLCGRGRPGRRGVRGTRRPGDLGGIVFRKKWFWIILVLVVIGGGAAGALAPPRGPGDNAPPPTTP